MGKTKVCSNCGKEKLLTNEFYYKRKDSVDGYRNQCKECEKKKQRDYYLVSCERQKEYSKKYREENREKTIEYLRQYRKENREKIAEFKKHKYQLNKSHILKQKQVYYRNNSKTINKRRKLHNINLDLKRISEQKRESKKRNLIATLTEEQWSEIKKKFNSRCAYCGMTEKEHIKRFNERLHQEHFIPLSSKGEYSHNNIITACRSCNSSKGDKDFFEWYSTYEHYDKAKEKFILEYLGYVEDTQQLSIL